MCHAKRGTCFSTKQEYVFHQYEYSYVRLSHAGREYKPRLISTSDVKTGIMSTARFIRQNRQNLSSDELLLLLHVLPLVARIYVDTAVRYQVPGR